MGVCINYRGKLKYPREVYRFIEDIEDICKILEWKYSIIDEDWNKPSDVRFANDPITKEPLLLGDAYLKGIIFIPPNSESFQFLFDKEGNLTDLMQEAWENSGIKRTSSYQWAKTQFAGVEGHITVIGLMKYIKKAYITNLDVKDEGQYWETENRELLEKNMGIINEAINSINNIAQNSENSNTFLAKLDTWLKSKNDK